MQRRWTRPGRGALPPLWCLVVTAIVLACGTAVVGEQPVVDCHTSSECLTALRWHLIAVQNVEEDLAAAYGTTALTAAKLLQLQAPLHRFNALTDRMTEIVDYVLHLTPHVAPFIPDARDRDDGDDRRFAGMAAEDRGDDDGATARAEDDGESLDADAIQSDHHARSADEAATDERLHSAGDLRSAFMQKESERFGSSSSTTTTTGTADQNGARTDSMMTSQNDRQGAEGASERRRKVLEEHRDDRELYLAKLETLHRLSRKVRAIKAQGSTHGRDPLPEIEYLEELNRLEEKRVGDGWPLADLDYDEFEFEGEGQPHDLRHRRHAAAGKEGAASDDHTDPGMRELYALQQEISRLLALPKSAQREQRMQELTDELLELWQTGKYSDYIRVVSLSSDESAARNTSWSLSAEGVLRLDGVRGGGGGGEEGDTYSDEDEGEDDDEDDEPWL